MNLKDSEFSVLSQWLTQALYCNLRKTEAGLRAERGVLECPPLRGPGVRRGGMCLVQHRSPALQLCRTERQILNKTDTAGSGYQRANPLKRHFKEEEALWLWKAGRSGKHRHHQWEIRAIVRNFFPSLSVASVYLLIYSRFLLFYYLFKNWCS